MSAHAEDIAPLPPQEVYVALLGLRATECGLSAAADEGVLLVKGLPAILQAEEGMVGVEGFKPPTNRV